tara:strand:- start:25220 stop:25594 length:375 start_codon:yes stop_codon:yes gene_type:complete
MDLTTTVTEKSILETQTVKTFATQERPEPAFGSLPHKKALELVKQACKPAVKIDAGHKTAQANKDRHRKHVMAKTMTAMAASMNTAPVPWGKVVRVLVGCPLKQTKVNANKAAKPARLRAGVPV